MPFGYSPQDAERIINQENNKEPYKKQYLEVTVIVKKSGTMIPISFTWEGKEYKIDKVVECQKGQSLKFGKSGLRYRCQCNRKMFYLYYTGDPSCQWYIELRNFKD